jgi:hypothetical protein
MELHVIISEESKMTQFLILILGITAMLYRIFEEMESV